MTVCFTEFISTAISRTQDISQGSVATPLSVVGSLVITLLQIYWWVCRWKNFENWL